MESKNFETQAIRTQTEKTKFKEHSTPLYLTSSYVFDNAEEMRASFADEKERNIYSRYSNPNTSEFIQKMCLLEQAESGFAFASGMAAVFSTFAALLDAGDHIISSSSVFGSTQTMLNKILPKWNISTSFFKVDDYQAIESLVQPNTKMIYAESPTNPAVDILDLEFLGKFAKAHDLILIIDNCFATPYLQQPIKFGADLVIHSATKLLDGQGRVLGGATVGKAELIHKIYLFARNTGPALSPFNAWVLSKSLETLAVRIDKHCENAMTVAKFLEKHPRIKRVKYPFLKSHPQQKLAKKQMKHGGNVVAFDLVGGLEAGRTFLDKIQLLSLTANLGDTRTIVSHPASTTHAKLTDEERKTAGITPGMVRISVGLEHPDDIIKDLLQALETN